MNDIKKASIRKSFELKAGNALIMIHQKFTLELFHLFDTILLFDVLLYIHRKKRKTARAAYMLLVISTFFRSNWVNYIIKHFSYMTPRMENKINDEIVQKFEKMQKI
mgnify:CR=1 FL=1